MSEVLPVLPKYRPRTIFSLHYLQSVSQLFKSGFKLIKSNLAMTLVKSKVAKFYGSPTSDAIANSELKKFSVSKCIQF